MDMNWRRAHQYGDYPVVVTIGDQKLQDTAGVVDIPDDMSGDPFFTAVHTMGTVQLSAPGKLIAQVKLGDGAQPSERGFTLGTVKVKPVS
jgi:hypothetical protein